MTKVFTDEKFEGYTFKATTESANVGFKHVCRVYDKNNNEVEKAKSVVNWGNRTWEAYQYASVFEQSKSLLADILEGIKKPEINTDFLNTLADHNYITDYGLLGDSDVYVILMDSWDQVEGSDDREYNKDTNRMEKTGKFNKSVYAKLIDLANEGRLKQDITYTLLNTDYVFTDEYCRCYNCGRIFNLFYGELTEVNYELLCDECLADDTEAIETLIDRAKEDFREALKPTVNQDTISSLGYSLVTDETFSFDKEFWGATYMTTEYVSEFIEKYNGFVQIYEVAQFVTPFQIWVANDMLEQAQAEINNKYAFI
jgi:hypothetical protein